MPYDDEWAISLRQRMAGVEGVLSYVRRNGRDQWTKTGTEKDGYRYTNEGLSTTDGVSLSLRTLEPGAWAKRAGTCRQAGAGRNARPTRTWSKATTATRATPTNT